MEPLSGSLMLQNGIFMIVAFCFILLYVKIVSF